MRGLQSIKYPSDKPGYFIVRGVSRILSADGVTVLRRSFLLHGHCCPCQTSELFESSEQGPVEALLFLQIGFSTIHCRQWTSMVAFDSRSKTSIHFSPFIPTTSELVLSLWHYPAPASCDAEGGRYPLSLSSKVTLTFGVRTFLSSYEERSPPRYRKIISNYCLFVNPCIKQNQL